MAPGPLLQSAWCIPARVRAAVPHAAANRSSLFGVSREPNGGATCIGMLLPMTEALHMNGSELESASIEATDEYCQARRLVHIMTATFVVGAVTDVSVGKSLSALGFSLDLKYPDAVRWLMLIAGMF